MFYCNCLLLYIVGLFIIVLWIMKLVELYWCFDWFLLGFYWKWEEKIDVFR